MSGELQKFIEAVVSKNLYQGLGFSGCAFWKQPFWSNSSLKKFSCLAGNPCVFKFLFLNKIINSPHYVTQYFPPFSLTLFFVVTQT